jgi:ABC-type phosphate/phosphonate transport system ATPase subunit
MRPFEVEDSFRFFGRERQMAALLGRLRAARSVVAIGDSGSGKSSLVRACSQPYSGFMGDAGSR